MFNWLHNSKMPTLVSQFGIWSVRATYHFSSPPLLLLLPLPLPVRPLRARALRARRNAPLPWRRPQLLHSLAGDRLLVLGHRFPASHAPLPKLLPSSLRTLTSPFPARPPPPSPSSSRSPLAASPSPPAASAVASTPSSPDAVSPGPLSPSPCSGRP